jgi:hypothetical protein
VYLTFPDCANDPKHFVICVWMTLRSLPEIAKRDELLGVSNQGDLDRIEATPNRLCGCGAPAYSADP